MRTEKQQEIVNFLEGLVHKRFLITDLNKLLSDTFNEKISLTNLTEELESIGEDNESADYNFIFESERDSTHGWYDIYMLHTREDKMYITEVSYDFDA